MFMFFFDMKHVEIKERNMLDEVILDDIPYVRVENRYPAYDDWYAEEKEDSVIIYRRSSELLSKVRDGRGMTNKEYYDLYSLLYGEYNKLLKREYTYELVKMFYERLKNVNNSKINVLEININYEIYKWGD